MLASPLAALITLAGDWHATYRLRGDPSFDGDSRSRASVTPVLGGRFVRIDYTWSESGEPQDGAMVVGCEQASGVVTVAWLDSWHNGDRMMICTGRPLPDGGFDVSGTYPAAPGSPDWGWRTCVTINHESWTMTMFNVTPEGQEALAVQAEYRRL